jgi:uncharacterized protein (TIGR02588 family)
MSKTTREDTEATIPGWAWALAAFGLFCVVGSAVFMLTRVFAGEETPPNVTVQADTVVASGQDYLVKITVSNRGEQAAAEVAIEGTLRQEDNLIETSAVTIDYVPAGSQAKAGLFFTRDPKKFDLQLRAQGYRKP